MADSSGACCNQCLAISTFYSYLYKFEVGVELHMCTSAVVHSFYMCTAVCGSLHVSCFFRFEVLEGREPEDLCHFRGRQATSISQKGNNLRV